MSRKSQSFAQGQSKFTWEINKVDTEEGRFKATCINYPQVVGFGDSEGEAMRNANSAMETAVDKAEI